MSTLFENPIISGFAPDPSVVCVDGTFFLVNSSFHVFPGLPIYASRDLSSWRHIGNAFNRPSQLSLERATTSHSILDTGETMVSTGGLFAPTIRFNDGVFYIICTNAEATKLQNFYITTNDIWSNQWSNPMNFDWNGIDPSLYFDDDNRAYIQGCWVLSRTEQPTCTIKQMEIDIKTGRPLSEPIQIWQGFAKYDSEGPHIYKKDGYFYLLIAEGGTFEHHMLSIARSRSIWGPYESCKNNPVLTADGTDENIQNTGHGELFQDENGQWWAVVLGVRHKDARRYPMGRETFLTPVSWPTGEWPQIQLPKMRFSRRAPSTSNSKDVPCITHQQERLSDLVIRDTEIDVYSISPDGLQITMTPSKSTLTSVSGKVAFLGKRQRALDCVANVTVLIDRNNIGKHLDAGLAIYKDSLRHAEIFYDHYKSEVCFGLHNQLKEDSSIRAKLPEGLDVIELRIQAAEVLYEFQYRTGKDNGWSQLGSVDTCGITARDMTGPILGLFAYGDDSNIASPVTFSAFRITPDADFSGKLHS